MTAFVTVRTWGEMVKFSHSVFALPFAMVATFLAGRHLPGGLPEWTQIVLIVGCMVAARSFAMTFNRIADAKIDARNPRTDNRPIPTGRITVGQAWIFLVFSGLIFVAACWAFRVLWGNPWPILLAVPTLVFFGAYSYAKRVTVLAHFLLGAAIAFAPTAAWIAIHPPSIGLPVVLLTGAVLFWIAGFDMIYACQDVDSDRRDGLFSMPARFGISRALWCSRGCHVLTIALLIGFGIEIGLGGLYWSAMGVTALLIAVEQSVVRAGDLSRVNLAFFTLNGCISVLLGAATVCDILGVGR
ncbi:MAG: UbiA-like polyprenyltransferase [Phycisphaerae bacterium]